MDNGLIIAFDESKRNRNLLLQVEALKKEFAFEGKLFFNEDSAKNIQEAVSAAYFAGYEKIVLLSEELQVGEIEQWLKLNAGHMFETISVIPENSLRPTLYEKTLKSHLIEADTLGATSDSKPATVTVLCVFHAQPPKMGHAPLLQTVLNPQEICNILKANRLNLQPQDITPYPLMLPAGDLDNTPLSADVRLGLLKSLPNGVKLDDNVKVICGYGRDPMSYITKAIGIPSRGVIVLAANPDDSDVKGICGLTKLNGNSPIMAYKIGNAAADALDPNTIKLGYAVGWEGSPYNEKNIKKPDAPTPENQGNNQAPKQQTGTSNNVTSTNKPLQKESILREDNAPETKPLPSSLQPIDIYTLRVAYCLDQAKKQGVSTNEISSGTWGGFKFEASQGDKEMAQQALDKSGAQDALDIASVFVPKKTPGTQGSTDLANSKLPDEIKELMAAGYDIPKMYYSQAFQGLKGALSK